MECEPDVVWRVLHICSWHSNINMKPCGFESQVMVGVPGLEEDLGWGREMQMQMKCAYLWVGLLDDQFQWLLQW